MSPHKIEGQGRRILVVDDDLAIRILLQAVLRRLDFDVTLAEDGEVGLQLLREETFDLVLLDLMMPKVSGYEFIERASELDGRTPHMIVFTAAGQRGIARIPADSVCDAILKPFDLEKFLELIERCLEGHPPGPGT
ncbi:MAG TPA: response regulator [Thermoanaerobaculia bacterium]|nr:response regulator [Thermoanaerobaculia bacterium]